MHLPQSLFAGRTSLFARAHQIARAPEIAVRLNHGACLALYPFDPVAAFEFTAGKPTMRAKRAASSISASRGHQTSIKRPRTDCVICSSTKTVTKITSSVVATCE